MKKRETTKSVFPSATRSKPNAAPVPLRSKTKAKTLIAVTQPFKQNVQNSDQKLMTSAAKNETAHNLFPKVSLKNLNLKAGEYPEAQERSAAISVKKEVKRLTVKPGAVIGTVVNHKKPEVLYYVSSLHPV